MFPQPIETNGPRLDFCTTYKGGAAEHDAEYVKKYGELQYHSDSGTLFIVRSLVAKPVTLRYSVCFFDIVRKLNRLKTSGGEGTMSPLQLRLHVPHVYQPR